MDVCDLLVSYKESQHEKAADGSHCDFYQHGSHTQTHTYTPTWMQCLILNLEVAFIKAYRSIVLTFLNVYCHSMECLSAQYIMQVKILLFVDL